MWALARDFFLVTIAAFARAAPRVLGHGVLITHGITLWALPLGYHMRMVLCTADGDLLLPTTGTCSGGITFDGDAGFLGLDAGRAPPGAGAYMPAQHVSVDLTSWALLPFLFDLVRVAARAVDLVCLAGGTSGPCLDAATFTKLFTAFAPPHARPLVSVDVVVINTAFRTLIRVVKLKQMLMRKPLALDVDGALFTPRTLHQRPRRGNARLTGNLAGFAPSWAPVSMMP